MDPITRLTELYHLPDMTPEQRLTVAFQLARKLLKKGYKVTVNLDIQYPGGEALRSPNVILTSEPADDQKPPPTPPTPNQQ